MVTQTNEEKVVIDNKKDSIISVQPAQVTNDKTLLNDQSISDIEKLSYLYNASKNSSNKIAKKPRIYNFLLVILSIAIGISVGIVCCIFLIRNFL
jgi:hypothetical protein